MKKPTRNPILTVSLTAIVAALAVFSNSAQAQVTFQQVSNGLVSLYYMDTAQTNGAVLTTPDQIGGRDMILSPAITIANFVAANRGIGNSAASVNAINLNQSGGATVAYYLTQGQNPLDVTNIVDNASDFFPFCNQLNATMSFWIKGPQNGGDNRFFGEAGNSGHNSPLYLWGDHNTAGGEGKAHLLFRQEELDPAGYIKMTDGSRQLPSPGYYQGQGAEWTASPVLDGTWHLFSVVIYTNGIVDVYVDGQRDPGALGTYVGADSLTHVTQPMIITNTYYTTNDYILNSVNLGTNPPPHGYVKWMLNDAFTSGATVFGGFRRGNNNFGGVNCQIDDAAFWNRALSAEEIQFVYTNGLPGIALTRPLIISKLEASVVEVGKGGTATLAWEVVGASTTPGSIVISGVGDVTGIGSIGSVDVVVTGDQVFTLTATSPTDVKQKTVSVKVFPGVDSNWNLFQRFDGVYANSDGGISSDIFGNRNWASFASSYAGTFDRWDVVTLMNGSSANKVLAPKTGYTADATSAIGYDSRGALAVGYLNSLTVGPNQTRTLFFRFSIHDPQTWVNSFGVYSDMDAHIGLTDYNWWGGPEGGGPAPAELFSKGPMVNIVRATTGAFTTSEPFDLRAYDWSGTATTNTYSYRTSVDPAGLQTNVNYMLWMDIENRNTSYITNEPATTTNMPLYSVYLQKEGDPTRTLLFSGYHANRNFAPATGGPNTATPFLDRFFANMGTESILTSTPGAYFETNMLAIDDIYLSKSGVESSIPRLFDLTSIVRNSGNVTINWNSLGSLFGTTTYSVQRKLSITDASWSTLTNNMPSGGSTTTFVDSTIGSAGSAYYRIVSP